MLTGSFSLFLGLGARFSQPLVFRVDVEMTEFGFKGNLD